MIPGYLGLADSEVKRVERFNAWVKDAIPAGKWKLIRQSLLQGQLTGNIRFIDEIEKKIQKRVECRRQGKPKIEVT